jgi:hypothetical protein
LNPFSQLQAVKKDSKNGAARKFFGPSYFVTALVVLPTISQNILCFPICRRLKVCQKSREIVGGVKIQMQLHKDFVLPQNSRQQRLTFGDFNVSAH